MFDRLAAFFESVMGSAQWILSTLEGVGFAVICGRWLCGSGHYVNSGNQCFFPAL
jgi:hypothetical protein